MTSSKYPIITWETGLRHEALCMIYYYNRLPSLDLQNRGFLVLPDLPLKYKEITIIFPHLNDPSLWSKAKNLNSTTPIIAPEKLISEVSELLLPTYKPPQTNFLNLSSDFFDKLFSILPEYQNTITKINLFVTYCGTTCQFSIVTPQIPTLNIYLRPDTRLVEVYRVIILALIRHNLQYIEKRSWTEIMTIADFIVNHTSLKNESFSMMDKLQQKQSGKLYLQSQKYQAKIGIPANNFWQIKNDQIFYQDKIISGLTLRQHNLLKTLVNSYGLIVSIDQIAKILWPNDENYSLWAIVKEIARIRKCIKSANLPGSLIQSHRKLGYSLS